MRARTSSFRNALARCVAATASALLWAATAEAAEHDAADREIARLLGERLKAELTAALQHSPEHAIAVCNERAPAIAAALATEKNVEVGRTALRVRNPRNAPTAWQRAALEEFERRRAAGEELASMETVTTVTDAGVEERRYIRAIGTEALCTTCHGATIAPSLHQAIAAKYPDDAATGFQVGDLRGAIYVIRRRPLSGAVPGP